MLFFSLEYDIPIADLMGAYVQMIHPKNSPYYFLSDGKPHIAYPALAILCSKVISILKSIKGNLMSGLDINRCYNQSRGLS